MAKLSRRDYERQQRREKYSKMKQQKQQHREDIYQKNAILVANALKTRGLHPRNEGQTDLIRALAEHDVTFALGIAGSGKTAVAIGLACQYLLEERVDKIIITRPCVEATSERKSFGALPGGLKEKMDPYLVPAVEEMKKFLGPELFAIFLADGKIEVAPLEFMRGRTFNNAFMILDEAQNATSEQIKMFITRIGEDSKICVSGDTDQSDRVGKGKHFDFETDLEFHAYKCEHLKEFAIVTLTESVRNPLIESYLRAIK